MSKVRRIIRREIRFFFENFIYIIVFSALFGGVSYFLDRYIVGELAIPIMLFIPSIIAITLTSFTGGFVSGVGLLFYFGLKMFLEHKVYNLLEVAISSIAYLLGGYFTGVIGFRIEEMRERRVFERQLVFNYFRNYVASAISFGWLTSLIIGLYKFYFEKISLANLLEFIGRNFSLMALSLTIMLLIQPIIAFLDKLEEIKRFKEVSKYKVISIKKVCGRMPIEIVDGWIGDFGAIEREWEVAHIKIKNLSGEATRFRIELEGPDIYEPNEIYTKVIGDGEIDEITFSIYPLYGGEREFKMKIMPIKSSLEDYMKAVEKFGKCQITLKYYPKKVAETKIAALNTFVGTLTILALLAKGIYDLTTAGKRAAGFLVATAFFLVELAILFAWYMYTKRKYEKELLEFGK